MRYLSILLLLVVALSCDDSRHLRDNYYYINYSDNDNLVWYCFRKKRCHDSGFPVIPSNIISFKHNENWIVAKTRDREGTEEFGLPGKWTRLKTVKDSGIN